MAIEKLKRYKSPGTDKIATKIMQARSRTLFSEVYKYINSVWNKEELPEQCKESITSPIYAKGDEADY
jgi:hypothetical protein